MADVIMKAPKGVTAASVAGVEYKVNRRGRIEASLAHVKALIEHGFEVIAEDAQDLIEGKPIDGSDAA